MRRINITLLRWFPTSFMLGALIFMLIGCSSGVSPTSSQKPPTPTAAPLSPTSTAPRSGTLLYQTNWKHGLSSWHASAGWKAVGGQLLIETPASASIIAPYRPTVANYAIEVNMQIVRMLKPTANDFTLFANGAPGKAGYSGGVVELTPREPQLPPPGYAQVTTDKLDAQAGFQEIDYVPGTIWHTYRIEVQGNEAMLFVDGTQVSHATSQEQALSTGPIGMNSTGLSLRVSSFRVTAL
jgi:hypothetical protein